MVVCHTMIPPYSPFGVQIREIHMFVNLSDIQIFQIFSRYSPVCLSLRYSSKTQSTVKKEEDLLWLLRKFAIIAFDH